MSTPVDEMKTAVIIEDDPEIRHILSDVLESAGFSTVSVGNGIDGVRAVLTYQPLLATVDVNMPGIDGFEAARRIRAAQSDTYIIMLTGLNDEADVVAGLGAGADDYLLKPFRPRELRARVDAVLRRTRGDTAVPVAAASAPGQAPADTPSAASRATTAPPATAGTDGDATGRTAASGAIPADEAAGGKGWMTHRDLRLHAENRLVTLAGEDLDLTRTEFDLLATLLESQRRVRSKADLTLVLRGESYVTNYFVGDADKRAVEAHMTNLRRKLGDNATSPRYIETVRGVGYRLTSEAA